jgi:hypothetical protein
VTYAGRQWPHLAAGAAVLFYRGLFLEAIGGLMKVGHEAWAGTFG